MDKEDRWLDLSEWRGETVAAMRAIYRELEDIKQEQKSLRKDFNNNKQTVNELRTKIASMSAIISVVTAIIVGYITRVII